LICRLEHECCSEATKAATRAVSDAIRHSSLGFFRMLGKTANDDGK